MRPRKLVLVYSPRTYSPVSVLCSLETLGFRPYGAQTADEAALRLDQMALDAILVFWEGGDPDAPTVEALAAEAHVPVVAVSRRYAIPSSIAGTVIACARKRRSKRADPSIPSAAAASTSERSPA